MSVFEKLIQMVRKLSNWFIFNVNYLGHPPWDSGISPPEHMEYIKNHPPGKALDLGCGTGTNVLALAKAGWRVTGVDFALKAVLAARQKLAAAGMDNARIFHGDVTRPSGWGEPFDLILDIGCFHKLPQPSRKIYLQNLAWLLHPGGTFLLYALVKTDSFRIGVSENDMACLNEILQCVKREDGVDRNRRSVWLTFRSGCP